MAAKTIEQLTEENLKLAEENKQLKQSNSDLTAKATAAQQELDTTVKINEELTRQIETTPINQVSVIDKSEVSKKTFKVEGETYGFKKLAVMYKGQKVGADEVLASKDLQAELVKIQSGLIYKK